MIEIIDAISVRLDELFGDSYTIYLESVEQNLQTPCFFIQPVHSSDKNMIDTRKFRTYSYVIDFIPTDDEGYRVQFVDVTSKLFDGFDSVTLSDGTILHTFNRTVDIVDEILHFTLQFRIYTYKPSNEIMQESMEMSVINNDN